MQHLSQFLIFSNLLKRHLGKGEKWLLLETCGNWEKKVRIFMRKLRGKFLKQWILLFSLALCASSLWYLSWQVRHFLLKIFLIFHRAEQHYWIGYKREMLCW